MHFDENPFTCLYKNEKKKEKRKKKEKKKKRGGGGGGGGVGEGLKGQVQGLGLIFDTISVKVRWEQWCR